MGRKRKVTSFATTEDLHAELQSAARRRNTSLNSIINEALTQYFSTKITRSSWDTDDADGWYDEQKFYVHSQDQNGHSAYLRVWIPKNIAGMIGRVVNSGLIAEYRSAQDFYRDALLHRAYKIAQWIDNDELKAEIGVLDLQSEEEARARTRKDATALIETLQENLQDAWDRGDLDGLEAHIAQRLETASLIPESHRDSYLSLLKTFQGQARQARSGKVRNIAGSRSKRPETANS